jgi:hypothetical protein
MIFTNGSTTKGMIWNCTANKHKIVVSFYIFAKVGAYGTICSIAFVISITNTLEPRAALPSHMQFAPAIRHILSSVSLF